MGAEERPENDMLALNSFLWDAAVSSREATKFGARRRWRREVVLPAILPTTNSRPRWRLSRKLSFTLVFGTFPMCCRGAGGEYCFLWTNLV